MTPELSRLSGWLMGLPGIQSARPVIVTIESNGYTGCLVTRSEEYQASERAVTSGWVEAGEQWDDHYLYLLGIRSSSMKRPAKQCYTWNAGLPVDGRVYRPSSEWYVSTYIESVAAEYASYHPFGPSFILRPWPVWLAGPCAGHKIDTLEGTYKRRPMTVTYV